MVHNRYQGPSFGNRGRRPSAIPSEHYQTPRIDVDPAESFYNRSNISATESRISETHPQLTLHESNISHRSNNTMSNRSAMRRLHGENGPHISPLHDLHGKPLVRHGTETIGDVILHPLKEFQRHTKRTEAYQAEKNEWNEKHPDVIAEEGDINTYEESIVEEIRIRLTIHFRHLVGDQDFQFTTEQIERIEKHLGLTPEEVEELKTFKDTDDLIDFLENTKRDYSVKVHKTVAFRAEIAQKKSEFNDSFNSFDLGEKSNTFHSEITNKPSEKHSVEKSDSGNLKSRPHKNHSPNDILVDLNNNVYLQIQFMVIVKEHEVKQRRAFFLVPDPDLSDEIGEETSATWVELLGDVFYVGWITNFTHSIHIDSLPNLGTYAAWFVVMWWTWCSSALYSSRYDRGDVAHHIYKIIELCGLIIMAGSSGKTSFEENPHMFIIGYIIMKSVILFQYLVVFIVSLGAHFKSSRQPLGIYVAASAVSIAMWGASLLYVAKEDIAKRYALWYVSIGMEVVVHILLQGNSRVSLEASHLGERFGLFTLIILGENCMGFIKMVSEANTTSSVITCNVFGVTIIFCYFFMYFDDFSGESMATTKLSQLWMYLHFPLHLFQVAFGIALTDVILNHSSHEDTASYLSETFRKCAASGTVEHAPVAEHLMAGSNNASAFSIFSASAEGAEQMLDCDPLFVIKIFWITGGLILCFNAFIKWINTPVKGAGFKSHFICISRILNAIVFFALSTTTYAHLDGLEMVSIMMACLLFQSAVDLLD
ncbi:bacterial low temperature requirement A protein-domain-containing protein [Helicostylum pulchrum]|uniref:Bacterial low temperature requirement A protein-domain-containing protein n=1 Tax=Helicostylum pulchrum TaxID=562976 RepID=A0ABP9XUD0_9FUNG|nr:bacterial low temperature requirement A protein-domain-containing protein [Helicostylum pulchrum]